MSSSNTEIFGAFIDGHTGESQDVRLHTLCNNHGLSVKISEWGAALVSVKAPDRYGRSSPVCLGYQTLDEYINDPFYLGATIGRFPNRIARGRFVLNNEPIQLSCNSGEHHLHGGEQGLHAQRWSVVESRNDCLRLSCQSADGEQGYPGNIIIHSCFAINDNNQLTIEYSAETDRDTIFSMTNHVYWNLAGDGDIMSHQLQLFADRYLEVDASLIPTGHCLPVADTPYDFRHLRAIGITDKVGQFSGYDNYYIKKPLSSNMALIVEPVSGRTLKMSSTEPGLQFYTGHYLTPALGRDNVSIDRFHGFCLEAHGYPDSPNHEQFPSQVITPERPYFQKTSYQFGVE